MEGYREDTRPRGSGVEGVTWSVVGVVDASDKGYINISVNVNLACKKGRIRTFCGLMARAGDDGRLDIVYHTLERRQRRRRCQGKYWASVLVKVM